MRLKVKILKWAAGIPVAMLNNKTAELLGVQLKDRVSIKSKTREMNTIIDTVGNLVQEKEIAVSHELRDMLNLIPGEIVDVVLSPPPKSLALIKNKLNGKKLSEKEINEIIDDIVTNSLSEAEIALFVSAMYNHGMDFKETVFLTKAISKSGSVLNLGLKTKIIADKHSIGGVPGNRTTPIVVSICAAAGLIIPKSSSRAITSAAGTADVIEAIAKIEFSMKQIREIVKKTNGCLIWGGSLGLVPADDKIIQVEKMLKIDPESQLLASIISKKLAAGSKYVLIDIPSGKFAKVNKSQAVLLKNKFEKMGKYFKMNLKCVITDGNQPIGNGVGPLLELIDIIKILDPKQKGPLDLEKKSLFLAGKLLELTKKTKKGQGEKLAREILYSGKAFEKFKEIIKAQGGDINRLGKIVPSKFKKEIISSKSGKILEIDNKLVNSLARVLGCPADKASGLYLNFHVGNKVKKGEVLMTLYSESKGRLKEAAKFCKTNNCFYIK